MRRFSEHQRSAGKMSPKGETTDREWSHIPCCAAFCAMWRSPSEVLRAPLVSFESVAKVKINLQIH